MDQLTEADVRESFLNCSKGDAKKLTLPGPLADIEWSELDFLGWRDPKAPERAYIVAPLDGRIVGIALRSSSKSGGKSLMKSTMCSICLTVHASSGVSLFTAQRAGASGRGGNSVGTYICSDLQCSRYVRGRLKSEAVYSLGETIDVETRIERLRDKIDQFTAKVAGQYAAGS
ncbi:MAG TPA: FBP domain-containing protein [Actinocrinis sp.]|nr:FBP domain-containing protein [Actinocrinis sp.]